MRMLGNKSLLKSVNFGEGQERFFLAHWSVRGLLTGSSWLGLADSSAAGCRLAGLGLSLLVGFALGASPPSTWEKGKSSWEKWQNQAPLKASVISANIPLAKANSTAKSNIKGIREYTPSQGEAEGSEYLLNNNPTNGLQSNYKKGSTYNLDPSLGFLLLYLGQVPRIC